MTTEREQYQRDRQAWAVKKKTWAAHEERLKQQIFSLRSALQRELDGCWCDDRDGNSNPPHAPLCERCRRICAALSIPLDPGAPA